MAFGLTRKQQQQILSGQASKRVTMALQILLTLSKTKGGKTCLECVEALRVPYQTGSARFTELNRSGCLEPTGKRRLTSAGGYAKVYRVSKEVNFARHVALSQVKKSVGSKDITATERRVLETGLQFIEDWKGVKTEKGRKGAVKRLVRGLTVLGLTILS